MIPLDSHIKLAGFCTSFRTLHRTHIITKFGPKLHMYESQIKSGKAEAYAYMDRTYIRQWESDMRTESILKDVDR